MELVVQSSDWYHSSQDQTHNTDLKECEFYILANLGVASAYVGNPKFMFKLRFGRCAQCFACAYMHFWAGTDKCLLKYFSEDKIKSGHCMHMYFILKMY